MEATRRRSDSESSLDLQMPDPPHSPAAYTFEKVSQTKAFAEYCLTTRRNISPISQQYFTILRHACDTFLDASTRNFKGVNTLKLTTQVREIELEIRDRDWLRHAATEDQEKATAELLLARKLQMYARYGDYLAHFCHKLRVTADLKHTKDRELLSSQNRWTSIADTIKLQLQERERRQRRPLTFGFPDDQPCKELRALEAAAEAAGIDCEQALFAVTGYGERNVLFYNNLEDDLRGGNHDRLKRMLASDLSDINAVIPIELEAERRIFVAIIRQLTSHWCTQYDMVDDPTLWGESEEFRENYRTAAILRLQREKIAPGDKEKKREMEKALDEKKEKTEKDKQKILEEIEGFLRGNPPAGLQRPTNRISPKALHKSREQVYTTLHSLSSRAGRRHKWSMRRESQLQQLVRDSKDLEAKLARNKELTTRYESERDTWRAKAVSLQKEARRHGRAYMESGHYSPPPTYDQSSSVGTNTPESSRSEDSDEGLFRRRSRARSPLRSDTSVPPPTEEV